MSESTNLSERELEVLRLVAEGASNNEIAAKLIISPNTVKVHMRNIYSKLGVLSRTEATMEAVRRGMIQVPGMPTPSAPTQPESPSFDLPAPQADVDPIVEPELDPDDVSVTPAHVLNDHADPETKALLNEQAISDHVQTRQRVETRAIVQEREQNVQPTHIAISRRTSMAIVGLLAILIVAISLVGWQVIQNRTTAQPTAPSQVRVANAWKALSPLPQPLSEATGVFYADALYIIGGRNTEGIRNSVARLDLTTNQWQTKASKPTAVAAANAVLVDQKIYVVGGRDANGAPLATLEIYDPATDRWQAGASMPAPRKNAMVAALDGKIYVFGGNDGTKATNTTFIYNPQSNSWSNGEPLPIAISNATLAQSNNDIVIAGGMSDNNAPQRGTWRYEFGTWQKLGDLPEQRINGSAVYVADVVYLIGGAETDAPILELQNDIWRAIDLQTGYPVSDQVIVANRRTVYAIGGWNGTTALAEARSWNP
ncbi:MAG: hypothetical protein KAX40_03950, partial [Herpetosiphon sp.]|nr:hypothetical protein [Herpetosiphon sp.]